MNSINYLRKKFCAFFLFSFSAYVGAEYGLTADSSCNTVVNQSGNTFNIIGGRIDGMNLCHSFSDFNIETGRVVDFQGARTIANIIVIGDNNSWIDGILKTSIAGANLYLVNPNGISLGPNASLDMSGSFHVSTTGYLKFKKNGSASFPISMRYQ